MAPGQTGEPRAKPPETKDETGQPGERRTPAGPGDKGALHGESTPARAAGQRHDDASHGDKGPLQGERARAVERPDIARPKDGVGFPEGSSTVPPGEMQRLRSGVSDAAWNDPHTVAWVEASASRSGSPRWNQELSDQRAAAVAREMKTMGFQGQIVEIGRGERPAEVQGKPDGVDDPADRVAIVTFEPSAPAPPAEEAPQKQDAGPQDSSRVEEFADHLPTKEDIAKGGQILEDKVLPEAHAGGKAFAHLDSSTLSKVLKAAEAGEPLYVGAEMAGWLEAVGVAGSLIGVGLAAVVWVAALEEIGLSNDTRDVAERRTAYYADLTSGFAAGLSREVFGRSGGSPPENEVRRAAWAKGYQMAQSLGPVQQRQVVANLSYINTYDRGESFQQHERKDLQAYRQYLQNGGEAMLQDHLSRRLLHNEFLWR